MKKALYFVALVLPEPIASRVRAVQEYIAFHFESKAAMRSPPHITLVAPFSTDDVGVQRISQVLRQVKYRKDHLEIHLKGFDRFGRRVIFVYVDHNDTLTALAASLVKTFIANGLEVKEETREFHPHVTVAFKDLSPRMFTHVWDYVQSLDVEGSFHVEAITLLKFGEGRWQILKQFSLEY